MIDLKAELRKLELGMKEEMMKDSPGKNSMMKHVDKMMDLKGRMKKARVEMMFEARKIMPEDKWKMFIRHHMKRGMHGKGDRMGCCGDMGMKGRSGCGKHGKMNKMKGGMKSHCDTEMK